jgi:hypothetical protein
VLTVQLLAASLERTFSYNVTIGIPGYIKLNSTENRVLSRK